MRVSHLKSENFLIVVVRKRNERSLNFKLSFRK